MHGRDILGGIAVTLVATPRGNRDLELDERRNDEPGRAAPKPSSRWLLTAWQLVAMRRGHVRDPPDIAHLPARELVPVEQRPCGHLDRLPGAVSAQLGEGQQAKPLAIGEPSVIIRHEPQE